MRHAPSVWYKRTIVRYGVGAAVVVALFFATVNVVIPTILPSSHTVACTLRPQRTDQVASLAAGDAVVVLERNGGTSCVDEVYAIYADGRIVSDYGANNVKETHITSDQVSGLLTKIVNYGFFSTQFFSSHHTPCAACFDYTTVVKQGGVAKTVEAVDGGTDAPANYWPMVGDLASILYPGNQ